MNGSPNESGFIEDAPVAPPTRLEKLRKTCGVLGLLMLTSLLFSYLLAYAVSDALATAKVLPRWTSEYDPRPMWLVRSFISLTFTFLALGGVARILSRRQLRRIDAMADE